MGTINIEEISGVVFTNYVIHDDMCRLRGRVISSRVPSSPLELPVTAKKRTLGAAGGLVGLIKEVLHSESIRGVKKEEKPLKYVTTHSETNDSTSCT